MDFRDLKVWQKSHRLTIWVYKATESFPNEEKYRLTDQLCRTASSIPANIAEGTGRRTIKEYIHFISNARGSVEEIKYHLILARDLDYLPSEKVHHFIEDYEEIGRMLNGLMNSLTERANDS